MIYLFIPHYPGPDNAMFVLDFVVDQADRLGAFYLETGLIWGMARKQIIK